MSQAMNVVSQTEKVRRLTTYLRLKPFDTTTPEGRAQERQRRILLTALAAAAAKGIAFVTTIVSVPLTINYLGDERFGMWATITAFVAMISFADLGMGNGLLNAISEAHGKDDQTLAAEYVSSGFFFLLGIACLFGISFLLVYPLISWNELFNVTSELAIKEAPPAIAAFVACFLISLPFGIVDRVQLGYQEGFRNSIWVGTGHLLGLGGLFLVIYFDGGLAWLVLALLGGSLLANLLNGLNLVLYKRTWLMPKVSRVRREAIKKLLKIGLLFFVLQIAVAVGYQSDNIVIAQILGADQVAQYAIPAKMFAFISIIGGFALAPLWPAYGEAMTRKDYAWIRQTFRRSTIIALMVYALPVIFLIILGKFLLGLWVGDAVKPNYLLLISLGAWTMLTAIGGSFSSFMNGMNIVRFQIVTATMMVILNIMLSIFLVQKIGVAGAALGSFISVFICIVIPSTLYLRRYLRMLET